MGRALLVLTTIVAIVSTCYGQLSTEEKQRALDYHNEVRRRPPAGDMRQLEWNVDLAAKAQDYARKCFLSPNPVVNFMLEPGRPIRAGENLYNGTVNSTVEQVIEEWYQDADSANFVQLLWSDTYLLGCGKFYCPNLALPNGQGRTSGTLFVCNYAPSNYSERLPYTTTDDPDGCSCPNGLVCYRRLCVDPEAAEDPIVPDDDTGDGTSVTRRVSSITPRWGSLAGGTPITIVGIGFSADQVNGGNDVTFTSTSGTPVSFPCDVISYYSSTTQIVCVTRASPGSEQATYRLIVRAHEGGGLEEVSSCSGCTYFYRLGFTPLLEGLDPLSSVAGRGQVITMSGRFFTDELQNQEDSDDEFFTRILVGGVSCDYVDENGTALGAALLSETSLRGYVICSTTTGNRIESMNVTAVMANRGNSLPEFNDQILTLDNKLTPYTYQTHAAIEGVSPNIGSIEGGTRITVTLSTPLSVYPANDIQVYVGGVPCDDIAVVLPNSVECTTRSAPTKTLYYPCGRGLLREVWIGGSLNLDDVELRPRSELNSPQERAFRSNGDVREFGERVNFAQRYSGFFVPPLTSLYTFQIQSDDLSRLYLSPDTSEERKQIIAFADQHTRSRRDYFPSQTSEPVFLEAGSYYYIEALHSQFPGPWNLGFGAKVHSLDWTSYPYQADREVQRIRISSTVVKEQHEIQLGALPCVWRVTTTPKDDDEDEQEDEPLFISEFCLDIGDETLVLMSDSTAAGVEEAINSLEIVQRVGYMRVFREDSYQYDFNYNPDEAATFVLVLLSKFEISQSQIPDIRINIHSHLCNQTTSNATIEKIQELTFPDSFNLTFSDTSRSTAHFPINVTSETIQEGLTDLLGWECQELLTLDPEAIFVNSTFEEDDGNPDRDNSTSFCGRYSLERPDTLWSGTETVFAVTEYRYVCLAVTGSLPTLSAEFYFFRQEGSRFTSAEDVVELNPADSTCIETLYQDSEWQHVCYDLEECILFNRATDETLHTITAIRSSGGGTFWIDEFLIAKSRPSIIRTAAPAQPGGIRISYLEVSGGLLELPQLQNNSRRDSDNHNNETSSGSGSGSGSDSTQESRSQDPYVMTIATHTVTYTVDNCNSGLSLLEGCYEVELEEYENEHIRVDIERVAIGSPPVDGTFEVSIDGVTVVENIDHDVSPDVLEFFLEANYPEEGGFSVSRSGDCTGYQWEVSWESRGGDVPLMGVRGVGLTGNEPVITAERVIDGGVWLWPFRGDMLRHPSTEPQVEVIINDIPSSCYECACAFTYSNDSTPRVNSVFPYDGQGGTNVTLFGSNFTGDIQSISVTLGQAYCRVVYANETHIVCTASSHPAGWYDVNVHIDGIGFAVVEESVCFHYMLVVESISPNIAGIGGGQTVVIRGNGFLDFVRYGVEDIDEDFQNNPWFVPGFGLPDLGRLREFLCGYYSDSRLEGLNLQELDIEHVFDFADRDDEFTNSSDNSTSMRFNETDVERIFGIAVDPDFEVVDSRGSFRVSSVYAILYYLYLSFPSFVLIGDSPCIIVSANLTTIECTTPIHFPGRVNVSVRVLSESEALEDAFEYSVDESALIHRIYPECGPVSGGTTLKIPGANFLNEDSTINDIRVYIGRGGCEVAFANSSYIECITDPNRPRFNPVFISTPNGVAIWEPSLYDDDDLNISGSGLTGISGSGLTGEDLPPFPIFRHRLEVNSVEPTVGSVLGGTVLRITGAKFVEDNTTVYVGSEKAEIQLITNTSIECIVPSSSQVHNISFNNDTRFDPVLGYMFSWNVNDTLYVQVGDTVQWDWVLEFPGLSVNVFQTPDRVISTRLPGGFESETSTSGSFSFTFNEIGEYHYASVLTQTLVLRGSIFVQELQSTDVSVRVVVSGYEAEYDIFSPIDEGSTDLEPFNDGTDKRSVPDLTDDDLEFSICAGIDRVVDDLEFPSYDRNSTFPVFTYWICSTPRIYGIYPAEGTLETVFTINGIGFSVNILDNTVQMGGYECAVLSSNVTTIECRLNPSAYPPSFTDFPLSVSVYNLGDAYIAPPDGLSVSIRPAVVDISPNIGSLEGETRVSISGQAFTEDSFEVLIGDRPCTVMYHNYTDIVCITSPVDSPIELEVRVLYRKSTQYAVCVNPNNCTFEYSEDATPVVEAVSPTNIQGPGTTDLNINGTGFSSVLLDNQVLVGEYPCIPIESSSDSILCTIEAIPAGEHELSLLVCSSDFYDASANCAGRARIEVSPVVSTANTVSIFPTLGSIVGGTTVVIEGAGFSSDVTVTIGGSVCKIISTSYTTVSCETSSNQPGNYPVVVSSPDASFPATVSFTYDQSSTPVVTGVFPNQGQQGGSVMVTGSNFGSLSEETPVVVNVGQALCEVDVGNSNDTAIMCTLGPGFTGFQPVQVTNEMGNAMSDVTFFYTLQLEEFFPLESSLAGLNPLTLTAQGFNPTEISITVCSRPCELSLAPTTRSTAECIVPPMLDVEVAADGFIECNVTVESLGVTETFVNVYIYRENLTPVVSGINRTRGGTQGGSRIRISGSGFTTEPASVTIADVECAVIDQDDTFIVCETGASGRTIRSQVQVYIPGKGFARSEGIEFFYIDLWSSRFTWGGEEPPRTDDFVVIPSGQTILLDTRTNILAYLLVQGGELIFDDEQEDDVVQLHTQGMLITDGGRLQVGTEEEPFLHKTKIILYGHVLSTEIPVYGAKTLALREGSIDMHGKPIDVTWTKLAETANAGAVTLQLQEAVDWEVGGKIVIAATNFSQRENEEKEIQAIDETGTVITITTPLEYEHISIRQTIEGIDIDTSAEVGYLTRNIVVRGNLNEEWLENVPDCPEEFRPGQFDIQTCFFGRFGEETISDQFGSQIMIHAAEQNQGDVFGRFEYIEVTHAGQAFRLGRYPIHFHLNGDVSGSYVRGCAIHHTFNRAVTVHAVDRLLIEKNVAYNILGHAYFLEDGIEQHNIIENNLGVFIRASSSLLNVDITPATFWIVNPNNIVRNNAAAGGTHFGFWYRLPQHPTGPSETSDVCPRHLPVEEFSGNTAHSFGWYGLWVFPDYHPRVGGGCSDTEHSPAVFNDFLAWRNDRGVEFTEVGSLQLKNSIMLDNRLTGVEVTELDTVWGENGTLIQNTLIVGHSDISAADPSFCTEAGIRTPRTYFLTVSDVTFVNFDRSCFVIQACSDCEDRQGGFETRYSRISLVNSPNLTIWQWQHEHVHRDMDGTLTGTQQPSLLTPTSGILPPTCTSHPESSSGVNGSICDGSLRLGRFALFDPLPSSLAFTNLFLTNNYGTVVLEYVAKRLLGTGAGYMGIVPLNKSYSITSAEESRFTNISYSTRLAGFLSDDYIIINEQFPISLDFVSVNDNTEPLANATVLDPDVATTGDWISGDNNTVSYIISGRSDEAGTPEVFDVDFSSFRCFYEDCIPPPAPTVAPPQPPGRPDDFLLWSDPTIWPNQQLPAAGENVFINCSFYVVVDIVIPRLAELTICGALELGDTIDHVIEVDLIFIRGGRLVAGYPDVPFIAHSARFILHGNLSSPELFLDNGPNVGAKAIAAFGELVLHGQTRTPIWTRLAEKALPNDFQITVAESVDWQPGERIVITSTSFDAEQTEVFEIDEVADNVITLKTAIMFEHSAEIGDGYSLQAEVGLLTRNIVIENGNPDLAEQEAFGCRVLVSTYLNATEPALYVGQAQIRGVEFKGCGQLGYTESFDPRFALAFLNINPNGESSYVNDSSFHDGYNTGLGVFITNGMRLHNNVIHSTVGTSVHVSGSRHTVTNNLASLAIFLGTYRGRNEPGNFVWTANFELTDANDLKLIGNVASGGARAGFHTNGEECSEIISNAEPMISGNVAHSTLHGIHMAFFPQRDGFASGCSRFHSFTIYSCFHYGIFGFSQSGMWITDTALVNNKAGLHATVIGPRALDHILGDKEVLIENSVIVSASEDFTCAQDSVTPAIASHPITFSGLASQNGGHAGILIPSFVSGNGHFPQAAWFDIINYPAINGLTTIRNVKFVNFNDRCGKTDVVLVTNLDAEDATHPVYLHDIQLDNVSPSSKVFNHEPHLSSVNPADCVDMDCDGLKHVLIKDFDGSFAETNTLTTIISMAEFQWLELGGDPRRGIGDMRIPRTMLSRADGSRIPVDSIYPKKGIVRGSGFGDESQCSFNTVWNAYQCTGIDHLMIVIESLDADTEVRRLSPIGLGSSNGFIDLLNGPQDHGWCGGYTCQERISTFYGIVAAGMDYTMGLTSTNPQNMALHLLNANSSHKIVIGVINTNPQRLDVYVDDMYVVPKNAIRDSQTGNLMYMERDPNNPDQFLPTLTDAAGSNFYDRDLKTLYVTLNASRLTIMTTPVIQVSLTLAVTAEDFFDSAMLVSNLAFLLGIDESRIRIVNVVRETVSRKRQTVGQTGTTIDIEIGDPPVLMLPQTTVPETGANETTTEPPTESQDNTTLTFEQLEDLTEGLVEVIQTGELTQQLNVSVVSATIEEPEPPPEDPTGGVRATPDTGGLQPEDVADNATIPTFSEVQMMMDLVAQNESTPTVFSIPTRLEILRQQGSGFEGRVFSVSSLIAMYDNNGEIIRNLGLGTPWTLTASIVTGPEGAVLFAASSDFINGVADFSNLTVSLPGSYQLLYTVTYPLGVDFSITAGQFTVAQRLLELSVSVQPGEGNISRILFPYPTVQLIDSDNGEHVTNHSWRNRTWIVSATVRAGDSEYMWTSPLSNGEAQFTEILITEAGTYQIEFTAFTQPSTENLAESTTSESFEIIDRPITKVDIVYNADFDSVVGNDSDTFSEVFISILVEAYGSEYDIEFFGVTVNPGSIVVSFFAISRSAEELVAFVDLVTSDNDTFTFTFNGEPLAPASIVQDPAFPVLLRADEDKLVLILAAAIPSGTILLSAILLIVIVALCHRHHKNTKVFRISVKPATDTQDEERYITRQNEHFADSERLDKSLISPDLEAQPLQLHEMKSLDSRMNTEVEVVGSPEVEVEGSFVIVNPASTFGHGYSNPSTTTAVGNLDMQNSFEEIWSQGPSPNVNKNGNKDTAVAIEAAMFQLPHAVADKDEIEEIIRQSCTPDEKHIV